MFKFVPFLLIDVCISVGMWQYSIIKDTFEYQRGQVFKHLSSIFLTIPNLFKQHGKVRSRKIESIDNC